MTTVQTPARQAHVFVLHGTQRPPQVAGVGGDYLQTLRDAQVALRGAWTQQGRPDQTGQVTAWGQMIEGDPQGAASHYLEARLSAVTGLELRHALHPLSGGADPLPVDGNDEWPTHLTVHVYTLTDRDHDGDVDTTAEVLDTSLSEAGRRVQEAVLGSMRVSPGPEDPGYPHFREWLRLLEHDPHAALAYYDKHEVYETTRVHWDYAELDLPVRSHPQALTPPLLSKSQCFQALRLIGELRALDLLPQGEKLRELGQSMDLSGDEVLALVQETADFSDHVQGLSVLFGPNMQRLALRDDVA